MWKDDIDARAGVAAQHLRDFARHFVHDRAKALRALCTGLDAICEDGLRGLSETACDRLLDAIGEAEREADRDHWIFNAEAREHGFPSLVIVVATGPDGEGAARNPKLRIAAMHARRLRGAARTGAEIHSR